VKKKVKRQVTAAAVTAAASASVLVGGLFAAPADLLADADSTQPAAVTELIDDDDDGCMESEEKRRGGVRARLRRWILSLPVAVRALAGVPLWCVGWVLLTGVSVLFPAIFTPAAGAVAGWLCLAAMLLAVYVLTAKAVFPQLPLKKILNRRSALGIAAATALLGIADAVAPTVWPEYARFESAVRLTGSFVIALTAIWLMTVRELRRRLRAEEAEPTQEEIQRRARELADSVK
jgi:hypothetical protein